MDHIGREVEATALGQTWRFSRCTRTVWKDFREYAAKNLPDPIKAMLESIDVAAAKDAAILRELRRQDVEEEKTAKEEGRDPVLLAPSFTPISNDLTKQALEKKTSFLNIGSPEMSSFSKSPEGGSYLVYLLLRKNHPDITEDDAYDVMMAFTQQKTAKGSKLDEVLTATMGVSSGGGGKNE